MNLLISQPLQLIIVEYLMKQSYKDVAGLIQQLQRLQPAPTALPVAPPPEKNGEAPKETDKKTAEA